MIHIINDYPDEHSERNEYTSGDGKLVEKWLTSHGEDIAAEIDKRRIATADMSEDSFHHLEIPTGIAAKSELGKAMMRMAEQEPVTFELLFIMQGIIHRILPPNVPIRAKITDIMDIDNNYSVRPEVVITIDI